MHFVPSSQDQGKQIQAPAPVEALNLTGSGVEEKLAEKRLSSSDVLDSGNATTAVGRALGLSSGKASASTVQNCTAILFDCVVCISSNKTAWTETSNACPGDEKYITLPSCGPEIVSNGSFLVSRMNSEQFQAWDDCKVAAAFLQHTRSTLYFLLVFLMLAPIAVVLHRKSPLTFRDMPFAWHSLRDLHYYIWVAVVVTGTGLFFKVVALAINLNERVEAVFKIV